MKPARILTPLLCAAIGCGSEMPISGPDVEHVTASSAPIFKGSDDAGRDYAVAVGTGCSGTLISPFWVLTANHCITGADADVRTVTGIGVDADVQISIIPAGDSQLSSPNTFRVWHRRANSGPIIVMRNARMQLGPFDSQTDAARDLALIRLDQRVPRSVAVPLHPPLLTGLTCPGDDFEGVIVGYANDTSRQFNTKDGYWRDTVSGVGQIYKAKWNTNVPSSPDPFSALTLWQTYPSSYGGIDGGDSGGPLVYDGFGAPTLCGVASGTYLTNAFCWFASCWAIGQRHTSVDSAEASAFLGSNVLTQDIHGATVFEGECSVNPNSDLDSDGDGFLDDCDFCPFSAQTNEVDNDADCDGVIDVDDNCPLARNPGQENTDLDDYGDACDPCPYDAPLNSADDYGDADFDGVCNSVDNCLTTANPDQVNTNRLYENVYTSNAVWGDACEPVPQPRTEIDSGVSVLSASSSSNSFFDLTTYEIRQRKFTVTPQRSMPAPSSGPGFGQSAGALTTHFRFCQPGPNQTPPFCTAATSLDEAQLRLDLAGADQETPDMPYHRITLAGRQRGDTVVHSHTYSPSSDSGLAYEWLADDDAIFWKNNTIVDVPEPSGVLGSQLSEGDGLEGMLWVHASTPIGNTVNLGTGLHGPQLANALVPIDVYDTRSTTTAHPVQSIFDIYQIRQHWPDIWDPYQLVLGQQVYHLTDAEIPMSESAQALIKDRAGVQWLAPELASMKMGNGPAWVGLSEGGGGIAAALFIDEDGVILSHHDLGIEFEDKSGESATLSIYSRALGAVFSFTHRREGQTSIDRISTFGRGTPEPVVLSIELGRVIDATAFGSELLILDEIEGIARLIAADTFHGEVQVLAEYRRRNSYEDLALTSTLDGELLVSASGRRGHAVARFTLGESLELVGISRGDSALNSPAMETGQGIMLYPSREVGELGERPIFEEAVHAGELF